MKNQNNSLRAKWAEDGKKQFTKQVKMANKHIKIIEPQRK